MKDESFKKLDNSGTYAPLYWELMFRSNPTFIQNSMYYLKAHIKRIVRIIFQYDYEGDSIFVANWIHIIVLKAYPLHRGEWEASPKE